MCLTWGHNLRPFCHIKLSINLCLNFATWKKIMKSIWKLVMKMDNWRHLAKWTYLTLNIGQKSIVKSYFWKQSIQVFALNYLNKIYICLLFLELELIELFLTHDLSKIMNKIMWLSQHEFSQKNKKYY
jgi:hypothetical protein